MFFSSFCLLLFKHSWENSPLHSISFFNIHLKMYVCSFKVFLVVNYFTCIRYTASSTTLFLFKIFFGEPWSGFHLRKTMPFCRNVYQIWYYCKRSEIHVSEREGSWSWTKTVFKKSLKYLTRTDKSGLFQGHPLWTLLWTDGKIC